MPYRDIKQVSLSNKYISVALPDRKSVIHAQASAKKMYVKDSALLYLTDTHYALLFTDTRIHHFTRRASVTAGHRLSQHYAFWISLCSAVPPLHCLLSHPQGKAPPLFPSLTPFLSPQAQLSVSSCSSYTSWLDLHLPPPHWLFCRTAMHSGQQWLWERRGGVSTLTQFQFALFDSPGVAVNSFLFQIQMCKVVRNVNLFLFFMFNMWHLRPFSRWVSQCVLVSS